MRHILNWDTVNRGNVVIQIGYRTLWTIVVVYTPWVFSARQYSSIPDMMCTPRYSSVYADIIYSYACHSWDNTYWLFPLHELVIVVVLCVLSGHDWCSLDIIDVHQTMLILEHIFHNIRITFIRHCQQTLNTIDVHFTRMTPDLTQITSIDSNDVRWL